MSTEKIVMNALFGKTELKSEKVELALVDDLKSVLNGIENDSIYETYSDTIKISSDLEILKKKANDRFSLNEKVVQALFQELN